MMKVLSGVPKQNILPLPTARHGNEPGLQSGPSSDSIAIRFGRKRKSLKGELSPSVTERLSTLFLSEETTARDVPKTPADQRIVPAGSQKSTSGSGADSEPASPDNRSTGATPSGKERLAAIEQEIRNDPEFQRELLAFQEDFRMGFEKVVLAHISAQDWVNHALGVRKFTQEQLNAKLEKLNSDLGELKKQTETALSADFERKAQVLLGGKLFERGKFAELPLKLQLSLIRLQKTVEIKMSWLSAFDDSAVYKQVKEEYLRKVEGETPGTAVYRLNSLKSGNPAVSRMLKRCTSDDPEARENAFNQLIAWLGQSTRQADAKLLMEVIRAAAMSPAASVKVHAAEAMLVLPDDRHKAQLMKEWLASDDLNNQLAVLKLFTLTQGPYNISTTRVAHEIRRKDSEIRKLIDGLRQLKNNTVEHMLGVIDEWDAARFDWERRAKKFMAPSRRFFSPPAQPERSGVSL
ncbi:MAG TPA: hypothetical protein V6C52_13815 [Coleofasciculaceae cyanobacterium]|jgi:hypothetical protein